MLGESLKAIGEFIFMEHPPQPCDAIMIVGSSHPESGERAAELWKAGYAPLILISGGVGFHSGGFPGPKSKMDIFNKQYATEYNFFLDVLRKNGVPASAILGENKSSYTKENAFFTKALTDYHKLHIEKAILICKAFHARRSLLLYQLAFPDTQFFVAPISAYHITKENWFSTEYGIKRVLGELARCGTQCEQELINYMKGKI